jgi:hypothetical protein
VATGDHLGGVWCGVRLLWGRGAARAVRAGWRWLDRLPEFPAGSAVPRTNVLPWCLHVKQFQNEFSDPAGGIAGEWSVVGSHSPWDIAKIVPTGAENAS